MKLIKIVKCIFAIISLFYYVRSYKNLHQKAFFTFKVTNKGSSTLKTKLTFREFEDNQLNNSTNISINSQALDFSNATLEDWLMISSKEFLQTIKFPPITLTDNTVITIRTDPSDFRINDAFLCKDPSKPPNNKLFYFRSDCKHLYYAATSTDINILGVLEVSKITTIKLIIDEAMNEFYCFTVTDTQDVNWKICSTVKSIIRKWVCKLNFCQGKTNKICEPEEEDLNVKVITKNIIKQTIVIPLPSPFCNEGWNYRLHGDDWNCECKEGTDQSPIDLPIIQEAIVSPLKPLFQYKEVEVNQTETTIDGQQIAKELLKIQLIEGHFKIFHNNFGKLVTIDGTFYIAEEIVIHTPAEHKINGESFDMEVQIIHYGHSKGDIAKQAILSFLFKREAGSYNSFLDDLNYFNLPNPITKDMELKHPIFIPKILYPSDSNDIPIMKPFSFYTYQGSLTFPPCTEQTIVYVASHVIPLSSTTLQLFQEALRVPDMMTKNGDVIASDWLPTSNRNIQNRNGRPVYHYNHEKYCGPDPVKPPERIVGHYERINKSATKYFYVNGSQPSGLPGAFVVSEREAKGIN